MIIAFLLLSLAVSLMVGRAIFFCDGWFDNRLIREAHRGCKND